MKTIPVSVHASLLAALAVTLLLTAGCERRTESAAKSGQAARASAVEPPADLFLAEAPANPRSVAEVLQQAEAGQEVVLSGRVGGSRKPFVENRAIFTLADLTLPSCSDKGDDHCDTPWDYCCEPKERLATHLLTVQVVDEAGQPLKCELNGRGGLQPNSSIVLKGRVLEKAEQRLIVAATGIHVLR